MTSMPLAVPETDRIAALLAEVTGRIAPSPRVSPPAPPKISAPAAPPVDVTTTQNVRASVRQMLEQANWRNEAPQPIAAQPPPERFAVAEPGPLPAPFGVLTVATLFGLVNWRNRPEEARPLPTVKPPPPPGFEFTVEAMITTFGWE
jgi:hypothetical protein